MPIVCIDGINGSGKTTQAKLMAERISTDIAGARVAVLADPGVRKGSLAELMREGARMGEWKHVLTRGLLFMAARCELVAEIRDFIGDDDPDAWVVLDRYIPSFCVYQLFDFVDACGGRLPSAVDTINGLHRLIGAPTPDLTFILSVDPEVGIERYRRVGCDTDARPDVFEKNTRTIHKLYHQYIAVVSAGNSFYGTGDMSLVDIGELSAKAVHERLWASVAAYISQMDNDSDEMEYLDDDPY